jgi:hypothetical protein
VIKVSTCGYGGGGALGGTRTPNLLIRSYWRAPAPFNRCSSVCVRMAAHGSCSVHGLLYTTAVQDDVASELVWPSMCPD